MRKTLGCSVEDDVYYTFIAYAKQEGMKMGEKLKDLVAEYLAERSMPNEILAELEKISAKSKVPPATPKQIEYINTLYDKLGTKDSERKTPDTLDDADILIKRLKKLAFNL